MPLRRSGQGGSCFLGFGSLGFPRSLRKVPWTAFVCEGLGFLPAVIRYCPAGYFTPKLVRTFRIGPKLNPVVLYTRFPSELNR